MAIKEVKPLFEILLNLTTKEADLIKLRLIQVNRRGENSRLLELFNLIVFRKISSDIRAAREMGYVRPGSAYANTKKRLLNEVMNELHQIENHSLRANEFPDDQIIIHQLLSDAHLMWKRGQLEVAIYFFNEAYGVASIHEDYFLLTNISHRLKVLSTYHKKTIGDFYQHAKEVEAATKSVMLINDLSTAYYQLRFADTFFTTRTAYENYAQERLNTLRNLYKHATSPSVKVQTLNQMIQCHEALGTTHGTTGILKLILKLIEFLPTHSLTIADAAIKQARYYLLKKDYKAAIIALQTHELQKVIASNRLFIYKEWLVIALIHSHDYNGATAEIAKLKQLQSQVPESGRPADADFLEMLLKKTRALKEDQAFQFQNIDSDFLTPQQKLRRRFLMVARALRTKNVELLKETTTVIQTLLKDNLMLNSPRNRLLLEITEILPKYDISICTAQPEINHKMELLKKYEWHPLCDDSIAIDNIILNELNTLPEKQHHNNLFREIIL